MKYYTLFRFVCVYLLLWIWFGDLEFVLHNSPLALLTESKKRTQTSFVLVFGGMLILIFFEHFLFLAGNFMIFHKSTTVRRPCLGVQNNQRKNVSLNGNNNEPCLALLVALTFSSLISNDLRLFVTTCNSSSSSFTFLQNNGKTHRQQIIYTKNVNS